jgi:hypothetical protein
MAARLVGLEDKLEGIETQLARVHSELAKRYPVGYVGEAGEYPKMKRIPGKGGPG